MTHTDDLFADQGDAFAPQPDRLEVVAGKVVATLNQPSAAQKRFNTLMDRIDREQRLLETLRHALDTHGSAHRQAMTTLMQESQTLVREMVLLLDQRIQVPAKAKGGLTARHKQQATRLLLDLVAQLDDTGTAADEAVAAIRERYAPADEAAEANADQQAEVQALLEGFLGEDFAQGRSFDSPEDVLRAAMEHERQRTQRAQEKREAKRAARKAAKAPTAREQAAAQKELDAKSALRTVYRQLASALHPDREPDPEVRARKTALMSQVNAAYERQELSVLLRMQLENEMVDASKAAALTDARLKALCDLLNEQLGALLADQKQLRQHMAYELDYPPHGPFSEAALLAHLEAERSEVADEVHHMRADLQQVQDDAALKRWLKQQLAAQKASPMAIAGFDIEDVLLHAMMQRRRR